MPTELVTGKPTTRRYSSEEKAAAVRMVRTLRAELGVTQGTVQRVATQLGELEQENRELRRGNEVLKRAASFFGSMSR
jgi:transposase